MNKLRIDRLIQRYAGKEKVGSSLAMWSEQFGVSQYEDRSSKINYSFVRHLQPRVVVEFGTLTGRCTHDILRALIKNNQSFTFKAYEKEEDSRKRTQGNIDSIFTEGIIKIGGDITTATDIPIGIDYLFIDNSHDKEIAKWVVEKLLPRCKIGCVVQIHDWNYPLGVNGRLLDETEYFVDLYKKDKLPLKKLYWTWESEEKRAQSSWWVYVP